jgi:hypothetical protein
MLVCPIFFSDILFVSQYVTYLLKHLKDSTVFNVECHKFEHFYTELFVCRIFSNMLLRKLAYLLNQS